MDITRLVEELNHLCIHAKDKVAEVRGLLEGLSSEDQRREVVRYRDKVSKSRALYISI